MREAYILKWGSEPSHHQVTDFAPGIRVFAELRPTVCAYAHAHAQRKRQLCSKVKSKDSAQLSSSFKPPEIGIGAPRALLGHSSILPHLIIQFNNPPI
jgi:hypothetical protein